MGPKKFHYNRDQFNKNWETNFDEAQTQLASRDAEAIAVLPVQMEPVFTPVQRTRHNSTTILTSNKSLSSSADANIAIAAAPVHDILT